MSYRRVDQALCDRVRILTSCGHSERTISEIAGISRSAIWAMKKRGYRAAKRKVRPMPSDFRIVAPTMSRDELIVHYKTSPRAILRWVAESGVRRPRPGQHLSAVHGCGRRG